MKKRKLVRARTRAVTTHAEVQITVSTDAHTYTGKWSGIMHPLTARAQTNNTICRIVPILVLAIGSFFTQLKLPCMQNRTQLKLPFLFDALAFTTGVPALVAGVSADTPG